MNLRNKALRHGASEFGVSNRRNKKFYVVYNGKSIHFGAKGYSDYTKHKDKERRDRYRARHKKIRRKTVVWPIKIRINQHTGPGLSYGVNNNIIIEFPVN